MRHVVSGTFCIFTLTVFLTNFTDFVMSGTANVRHFNPQYGRQLQMQSGFDRLVPQVMCGTVFCAAASA